MNTVFLNHFIGRLIRDYYSFGNVRIELLSVDAMMEDTSRLKQSMSIWKMRLIFVDPRTHAVAFIDSGRHMGRAVSPQFLCAIAGLQERYPPALFWASEKIKDVDFSVVHVTPRNLCTKEDFCHCNFFFITKTLIISFAYYFHSDRSCCAVVD